MTSPFEPAGEQARWRYAYELFLGASVGDVIAYAALLEIMDLGPEKLGAIRGPVDRAKKELEEKDHRTLENVKGEGYRIADIEGHIRQSRRHQRKASRALVRGHRSVNSVDLNDVLDPEQRRAVEVVGAAIAAQIEFNRRVATKVRRHEDSLAWLYEESTRQRERSDRADVDLAEMQTRLARLEKKVA